MHYLWLFHSRNGLVCTHANERTAWRDRQGGEGKRAETDLIAQIKAMENARAWGLSSSSRRQCCWNNTHGRVLLSAESMKCLQHADRPWFHPTSDSNDSNMTDYNPHPSATVAFGLCLFLHPGKRADYDSAQIAFRYASVWPCILASGCLLLIKSWLVCKNNQQQFQRTIFFSWGLWQIYKHAKVIFVWRKRFRIKAVYHHFITYDMDK